jgi:hypothetical protein
MEETRRACEILVAELKNWKVDPSIDRMLKTYLGEIQYEDVKCIEVAHDQCNSQQHWFDYLYFRISVLVS